MTKSLYANAQDSKELEETLKTLSIHLTNPIYRYRLINELKNRGYEARLIIDIMKRINPMAFSDTTTPPPIKRTSTTTKRPTTTFEVSDEVAVIKTMPRKQTHPPARRK